jgi:phospholipase D-like protein
MFQLDLVGVLILALWVFAVFDVIKTDRTVCRNLPKEMWLLLVIILPALGAIAWFIMGRPENARFVPGSTEQRRPGSMWRLEPRELPGGQHPASGRHIGPEDNPEFMRSAEERRLRAWEEELRRREEELRKRERGEES